MFLYYGDHIMGLSYYIPDYQQIIRDNLLIGLIVHHAGGTKYDAWNGRHDVVAKYDTYMINHMNQSNIVYEKIIKLIYLDSHYDYARSTIIKEYENRIEIIVGVVGLKKDAILPKKKIYKVRSCSNNLDETSSLMTIHEIDKDEDEEEFDVGEWDLDIDEINMKIYVTIYSTDQVFRTEIIERLIPFIGRARY